MAKFGIYLEQDGKGKDTGRFQVAEEGDDYVIDTFDTEKEAEKYMKELQAESDRNDKIKADYLAWEKECRTRYKVTRKELRVYLVNSVCV